MNYDIVIKILERKQTSTNALRSTTIPCEHSGQVLALTCSGAALVQVTYNAPFLWPLESYVELTNASVTC
jgi:hypothetical protein